MSPDESFDEAPNLDEVLRHPMSRRAWFIRWGVLALTGVVVAAIFMALLGPRLAAALHPTHTTYALYITSNVTWGTLALTQDGHQVRLFTNAGQPIDNIKPSELTPFIRFTQGSSPSHITVAITAAPFITKRCELTLPPIYGDTCLGLDGEDVQTMGKAFTTPGAIPLDVDFPFTLNDLAPGKRSAVLDLIDHGLQNTSPPVSVVPGSHYATGEIAGKSALIVTQPLLAALTTQRVTVAADSCVALCAPLGFNTLYQGDADIWHVRISVQQTWNFTRASDGTRMGDAYENDVPHPLDFDLEYDPVAQSWLFPIPIPEGRLLYIADAVMRSLCDNGQGYLENLFFQAFSTLAHFDPNPTLVDHGSNGCLFQITATDQSSPPAMFLWRFGQMYVANAAAQNADPILPVASAPDLASFAR